MPKVLLPPGLVRGELLRAKPSPAPEVARTRFVEGYPAYPVFVAAGTQLQGTAATMNVDVPDEVQVGNVVVVTAFIDGDFTVTGLPSGFSQAPDSPQVIPSPGGVSHRLYVMWKRATAEDLTTATYDFTLSASTYRNAQATHYSGAVETGDPWDVTNGATDQQSLNDTPAVSDTTTVDNTLLVWAGTNWGGGAWTPPAGFTERRDSGDAVCTLADKPQEIAGSTGSLVGTCAAADKRGAWLGAMKPPTLVAPVTGSGTGVLTVTGTSGGVPNVLGAATGTVTVAGAGVGLRETFATATGQVTVTGASAGVPETFGAATGQVTVTGLASGAPRTIGTAGGTIAVTGVGVGRVTHPGVGSGQLTIAGTATGVVGAPPVTGSATGLVQLVGSGAGVPRAAGTATGLVVITGVSIGVPRTPGAAAGTITVSGVALATVRHPGSASGVLGIAGAATGAPRRSGSATGLVVIAGFASAIVGAPVHVEVVGPLSRRFYATVLSSRFTVGEMFPTRAATAMDVIWDTDKLRATFDANELIGVE